MYTIKRYTCAPTIARPHPPPPLDFVHQHALVITNLKDRNMTSFLAASSLLVVILTLVTGQQTCPQPDTTLSASYVNCKVLSNNNYELYWTYNDTSADLRIAARVRTSGWLGLGISPDGGMKDSDIAIGWVQAGLAILNVRTCVQCDRSVHYTEIWCDLEYLRYLSSVQYIPRVYRTIMQ